MRALVLVDLQNDFCPGGALAVPEGDQVIEVANRLAPQFELVIATQDWHPRDHGSFAANHPGRQVGEIIQLNGIEQILWPVHCVQGSAGARFHPRLDHLAIDRVFRKGMHTSIDSYSGFFENDRQTATGLAAYLLSQSVTDLYVMGLATDYCVKYTAQDACSLDFRTHLIRDGCRGVNLQQGDSRRALQQLRKRGVRLLNSCDLTP